MSESTPKKINKKLKALLLLVYVFFACLLVYYLEIYYLYSLLIVIMPPALLNFIWLKNTRKKVLIFSLATAVLFAIPLEIASRLANAWDVQSILPRIFGLAPWENLIFAFLNFFWGLSFYEYFINQEKTKNISPRFKYLIYLYLFFSVVIYGLYFYNSKLIALDYYLGALVTVVIPLIIFIARKPKILKKVVYPTVFFALVYFIYEMTALQIGNWWWPGQYLLPIKIMGETFPIDDLIIWYFLSTPALIAGYDFFADNG